MMTNSTNSCNEQQDERTKKIFNQIKDFIQSGMFSIQMSLYKEEIPLLEETFKEIIISRGNSNLKERGQYCCTVFKKGGKIFCTPK